MRAMNLPEFFEKYPDDASCIEGFKAKGLEIGIVCKKCEHTEHYFRKTDLKFQCKKCGSRVSLRSGTVMENSNLPFQYWMLCIELMTLSKKSFSALEMQRMLGHKRYESIWFMMHKIRRVMSKRDEKYQLKGCIEFDEGFFERVDNKDIIKEKENENSQKSTPNKRGRGSEKQAKVLVMVESEPSISAPKKGKPNRKVGYLKMVVMEDLKSETINKEVGKSVDKTASVLSDGYTGYVKLKEVITNHYVVVEPDKQKSAKIFPWVNRTISNAKKTLSRKV
ncbi:DDE transposase, partial [Flavobacterium psychrophilum DSM 3660 = ATCC 49418]|uniref:IS1595 family transposase n=4 Tax=Flavobacterium psychrophilum TaxID=96345 RepID=UPI000B649E6C